MDTRPPPTPLHEDVANAEQQDADAQAHMVAEDALGRASGDPSEDSERGGHSNPAELIPDDTPDLVDVMNQMVTSGQIDNGAFAGEPMHDDEETIRGVTDDDGDNGKLAQE